MTKREFLNALNYYLSGFKKEERDEILYDYEEHFRIGMESGKTEEDLIKELGNPKDIADQYRGAGDNETNSTVVNNKENSTVGSIVIGIALLFFNFFFAIWLYIGIACGIFGMCIGAVATIVAGLVTAIVPILRLVFPENVNIPNGIPDISVVFIGIGTTTLGILFCIGMFYLVKLFIKLTVKYVKWNIKAVKGV